MTKQEYLAKRKDLLESAENAVKEGKFDVYEAKEKEVKDLDAQFEQYAKTCCLSRNLAGSFSPPMAGEFVRQSANLVAILTPTNRGAHARHCGQCG